MTCLSFNGLMHCTLGGTEGGRPGGLEGVGEGVYIWVMPSVDVYENFLKRSQAVASGGHPLEVAHVMANLVCKDDRFQPLLRTIVLKVKDGHQDTGQSDPQRIGGPGTPPPRPPPQDGHGSWIEGPANPPPPPVCCLGVRIKIFKNHQNQPKQMGRRHGRHSKQHNANAMTEQRLNSLTKH